MRRWPACQRLCKLCASQQLQRKQNMVLHALFPVAACFLFLFHSLLFSRSFEGTQRGCSGFFHHVRRSWWEMRVTNNLDSRLMESLRSNRICFQTWLLRIGLRLCNFHYPEAQRELRLRVCWCSSKHSKETPPRSAATQLIARGSAIGRDTKREEKNGTFNKMNTTR